MADQAHAGGGPPRTPQSVVERSQSVILDSITDRALGKPCKDIFRANVCETQCSLRQTIETGTPIIGKRIAILDGRGPRRTISICTAILRDENGSVAESKHSAMPGLRPVRVFRDKTGRGNNSPHQADLPHSSRNRTVLPCFVTSVATNRLASPAVAR